MKVSSRFSAAMAKYTGCSGTALDCEMAADNCESNIRVALPDGTIPATASECEASRLDAAGKKARGILKCYAKAARNGVAVDTATGGCVDKVETAFSMAFGRTSGTPPATTTISTDITTTRADNAATTTTTRPPTTTTSTTTTATRPPTTTTTTTTQPPTTTTSTTTTTTRPPPTT